MNPIQKYYDTERNAEISWFWDQGFEIRFGDSINGYGETYDCESWQEVIKIFKEKLK